MEPIAKLANDRSLWSVPSAATPAQRAGRGAPQLVLHRQPEGHEHLVQGVLVHRRGVLGGLSQDEPARDEPVDEEEVQDRQQLGLDPDQQDVAPPDHAAARSLFVLPGRAKKKSEAAATAARGNSPGSTGMGRGDFIRGGGPERTTSRTTPWLPPLTPPPPRSRRSRTTGGGAGGTSEACRRPKAAPFDPPEAGARGRPTRMGGRGFRPRAGPRWPPAVSTGPIPCPGCSPSWRPAVPRRARPFPEP